MFLTYFLCLTKRPNIGSVQGKRTHCYYNTYVSLLWDSLYSLHFDDSDDSDDSDEEACGTHLLLFHLEHEKNEAKQDKSTEIRAM